MLLVGVICRFTFLFCRISQEKYIHKTLGLLHLSCTDGLHAHIKSNGLTCPYVAYMSLLLLQLSCQASGILKKKKKNSPKYSNSTWTPFLGGKRGHTRKNLDIWQP